MSSARKPSGSVSGGSVASRASTTYDVVSARSPVPGLDPADALAAQPAAGGHAQRRLVAGLDLGLDPPVAEPALARLGQRVVGQQPHRPGGVARGPRCPREQRPGELARRPSAVRRTSTQPTSLAVGLDDEARPPSGPSSYAACQPLDRRPLPLGRHAVDRPAEPVRDHLVVAGDRLRDVLVAPGPQRHHAVGQRRLLGTWARVTLATAGRGGSKPRHEAPERTGRSSPGSVTVAARLSQRACGTRRWRAAARPWWRTRAGRPARPRPPSTAPRLPTPEPV